MGHPEKTINEVIKSKQKNELKEVIPILLLFFLFVLLLFIYKEFFNPPLNEEQIKEEIEKMVEFQSVGGPPGPIKMAETIFSSRAWHVVFMTPEEVLTYVAELDVFFASLSKKRKNLRRREYSEAKKNLVNLAERIMEEDIKNLLQKKRWEQARNYLLPLSDKPALQKKCEELCFWIDQEELKAKPKSGESQ